jgi:tetratricopeptide (TPR) repeat protein
LLTLPKLDAAGSIPVSRSICFSFHPSSFILHPFLLLTLSLCLFVTSSLFGCSSVVKPLNPTDTPKDHYQAGMKLIGTKDAAKADAEFLRAIELDKNSPLGYAGMAALEMSRANYKNAVPYANSAIRCDPKFTEAGIIKGRSIMAHGRKNWPLRAKSVFQNVLDVDPQNKGALFYMGEACLYSFQFKEAQGYFAQRAELKDSLAAPAIDRIKLTIRILALDQITDSEKLIALSEKAARSEICQLLFDDLKLKDLVRIHRLPLYESAFPEVIARKKIPPDIADRNDRRTILDIISLHLTDLDVYPDGNFYPLRTVNRAEFAMLVQDIMALLNDDQTLATKYSDSESGFPDIRPDYFAFNAIMISANEGIMKPNPDTGKFNPDTPVSGIDAIEMIRALGKIYNR